MVNVVRTIKDTKLNNTTGIKKNKELLVLTAVGLQIGTSTRGQGETEDRGRPLQIGRWWVS